MKQTITVNERYLIYLIQGDLDTLHQSCPSSPVPELRRVTERRRQDPGRKLFKTSIQVPRKTLIKWKRLEHQFLKYQTELARVVARKTL